jgi:hypothetical protein
MEKSASADDKTPSLLRWRRDCETYWGISGNGCGRHISRGGSVAGGHRLCGTYWFRAGGWLVCGDPPVAGVCEDAADPLPTLGMGALTIVVMLAGNRWLPKWPAGIYGKVRHESCALIPLTESTGQLIRSSAQNLQQESGRKDRTNAGLQHAALKRVLATGVPSQSAYSKRKYPFAG